MQRCLSHDVAILFRGDGLRLVPPYTSVARTFTKHLWRGRTLRDVVQREFYPVSDEHMDRLVSARRFTLDGSVVSDANVVLRHNQLLESTVHFHEPPALVREAELMQCIVDESTHFVAVNKPASLVVHPTGRFRHNSLTFAISRHLRRDDLTPVHRLDRCASGLLLFAKSSAAARAAFDVFSQRRAKKLYVARVRNGARLPLNTTFSIDKPLPVRTSNSGTLSPAQTRVRAVRYDKHTDTSLVLCYPVTGRLHQIRLHLASVGTPIDGDPLHGERPTPNQAAWLWAVTAGGWARFARPGIDASLRDPLCPTCQRIGDDALFEWDDPFARDSVLSFPLHSLQLSAAGEFEFRAPLPEWCAPFIARDEIDIHASQIW